MIYQDPLQKNQNLMESNSVVGMESVQSPVESNQQNIDSSVIPTMAQNAIERLHKQKEEVVRIPDWRVDQILRTGGTAEEITRMTQEVNKQAEKSVLQGRYNIIAAIPEKSRNLEQQQEFLNIQKKLAEIADTVEKKTRGIIADQVEQERVADNLAKFDLNAMNPVSSVIDNTNHQYVDNIESMIATGNSLWGTPEEDESYEESSLYSPIQPTQESVNTSYQDYLSREVDSIGAHISAGFGNEQALDRGIELEKKLEQLKNNQTLETENTTTSEIVTEKESELNQNEQYIANLKRDELNQLYGILEKIGPIDGIAPDQLFATIKIFMRGASDDSLIPETYGLRAKMNEIKSIRDAELESHGIVIDKESGAVSVQSSQKTENVPTDQSEDISPESIETKIEIQKEPELELESVIKSEVESDANLVSKPEEEKVIRSNEEKDISSMFAIENPEIKERQFQIALKILESQSFKELLDVLQTEPVIADGARSESTLFTRHSILKFLKEYQAGKEPSTFTSITNINAVDLKVRKLIRSGIEQGNLDQLIKDAMDAYPELAEKEKIGFTDIPINFSEQVDRATEVAQEEKIDSDNPIVKEDSKEPIKEKITVVEEGQTIEVVEKQKDSQENSQSPELEIEPSKQEDSEDSYEFEKRLLGSLMAHSGEKGIFALLGTRNLSLSKDGYIIADGKETNYTPSMIDLNAEVQQSAGMTPQQLRESIHDEILWEKNNPKIETKQTFSKEKKKPEDLFLDDNNQEEIVLPEKKDFSHVKTFDELYALIDSVKEVQGSKETYSSELLKKIINDVRNGDAVLRDVTNTGMLRDKVRELLVQERNR